MKLGNERRAFGKRARFFLEKNVLPVRKTNKPYKTADT